MGNSRKPDASQRQELAWLLDEADLAIQSWWQGEAVLWPDVLTKLVSRLRLCGFDLEAEGIASDVQATPKIGRRGCRNHSDLMQLRRAVVDRVRKRLVALRNVMAGEPSEAADGMGWPEAREEAEKMRLAGNRFTSYGKMATAMGCNKSVLYDAITKHGSVELQEWASKQRGASRKNSPPEAAAVALKKTPQSREPDPADMLHDCDADVVLAKLLDQVPPDERARIHAMSPAEKRQLAETLYRDPDKEEQDQRYAEVRKKRPRAD